MRFVASHFQSEGNDESGQGIKKYPRDGKGGEDGGGVSHRDSVGEIPWKQKKQEKRVEVGSK